jgi:hypothetical protein
MNTKIYNKYNELDIGFSEYEKFSDTNENRARARQLFVQDSTYSPLLNYPEIDKLYDIKIQQKTPLLRKQKRILQEAIFDLGDDQSPEASLYADFLEVRLLRIMLTEASYRMLRAGSVDSRAIAAEEFTELGNLLYGEMDPRLFNGLFTKEKNRIKDFVPQTTAAEFIVNDLINLINSYHIPQEDYELIDLDSLNRIGHTVGLRYASLLSSFPDSDSSFIYRANDVASLFNKALLEVGLSALGWRAVVSANRQITSTSAPEKKIYIPSNIARNSFELKLLGIHEIEVHARRGENGSRYNQVLRNGTATYMPAEEGQGVLFEAAITGSLESPALDRAEERYLLAGIAKGLFGPKRDARQSHEVLWRLITIRQNPKGYINNKEIEKAKLASAIHIENAYRGTPTTIPGVIYPKLKVYLEGLQRNCMLYMNYEGDLNDLIDRIMLGKYNHTDISESDKVNEIIKGHSFA